MKRNDMMMQENHSKELQVLIEQKLTLLILSLMRKLIYNRKLAFHRIKDKMKIINWHQWYIKKFIMMIKQMIRCIKVNSKKVQKNKQQHKIKQLKTLKLIHL